MLSITACANDPESTAVPDVGETADIAHSSPGFSPQDVLGFEALAAWRGPGIVGLSPEHSEGASSLAVRPTGDAAIRSAEIAVAGIPRTIRLDVQLPAARPGHDRRDAIELSLDCADARVSRRPIGRIALDGLPTGAFTTLRFDVPRDVQDRLARGCDALEIAIAIDARDRATYRLDNLRILTDLVLHYTFDGGGARDSSGYGRDGALVGAAAVTPDGRTGGGLTLDGGTGYVTLPDGITEGLHEITVAAWVNLAQDRAWSRIVDLGGSAGFLYLASSMGNGQLRFSTYAGFGNEGTVLAPGLPLGAWKHIAVTTRGTDYRVYIDGVEAANQLTVPVEPANIATNAFGNWIGRSRFPDPLLKGRLDDIRIYDRALSAREIRALAAPATDYISYRFDDHAGRFGDRDDHGHGHHAERRSDAVVDSSDLHRDGQLVGGAELGRGMSGGALSLDGAGGHAALPAGIVAGCHAFTASAWIELRSNAPWNRVFDFGNADRSAFMYLSPAGFGPSGQELRFGLITPRGIVDVGYPLTIPLHEWQHVAVTVGGGTVALYFNGRSVAVRTGVTTDPADMGTTLANYLGKSQFPDPGFDGKIDDVRIACRAYDAREIAQLAHSPLRQIPRHPEVAGDIVPVHDPAIVEARGRHYLYSTGAGIEVRTSRDRVNWTLAAPVFATNPAWVVAKFGNLPSLWAPDVTWFGGTYHLYYAASTFGSNRSCIGHATKADLASPAPWQDLGPAICSNDGTVDNWNAIDPHVVLDAAGTPWMSFGSFWGGIQLIQLTATGERADAVIRSLASPPSTAIESSYIVYRAPYYYLFASFDFCCQGANSSYNVRVGRSTSVTGPYLDRTGLDMRLGGGTSVVVGTSRWAGPGGNAVVWDDGRWWNVYHAYDALAGGAPTLRISELLWSEGWPVSGVP